MYNDLKALSMCYHKIGEAFMLIVGLDVTKEEFKQKTEEQILEMAEVCQINIPKLETLKIIKNKVAIVKLFYSFSDML